MRFTITLLVGLMGLILNGQTLEHTWNFERISTTGNNSLFEIDPESDKLTLEAGSFQYNLSAKNITEAKGDYVYQHPLLIFFYTHPQDTIRRYKVNTLTDTTLVFSEAGVDYHFSRPGPQIESAGVTPVSTGSKRIKVTLESVGRGMIGMVFLLLVAFLMSSNRKGINWKLVLTGLTLQLIIAILVLQVDVVSNAFDWMSDKVVKFLNFSEEGAEFLFGGLVTNEDTFGYIFAFRVLPTIVFFSAFTALMDYLGILQVLVKAFAWVMSKTMGLSGAESLAAAANIFIGQTEAPLVVRPYLESMTRSEILCLMVGGMATIAGSVLAAFIAFLGGDSDVEKVLFAKHLLTASIMSAPAAIVMAKMLYPETEEVNKKLDISKEQVGSNVLDALSRGTTDGLKLAVNVGAMLLVFTAIMAVLNWITEDGIGSITGLNAVIAENTDGRYSGLSMQYLLGNLFAPVAWLIGVPAEDITSVGQLLGEKTILNEFYAYATLSDLKQAGVLTNYRSVVIATYALCGFANFASIGIQIGGIGVLAPGQRTNLARFGFKALVGGTAAALLTATIVGMFIG